MVVGRRRASGGISLVSRCQQSACVRMFVKEVSGTFVQAVVRASRLDSTASLIFLSVFLSLTLFAFLIPQTSLDNQCRLRSACIAARRSAANHFEWIRSLLTISARGDLRTAFEYSA